MGRGSDQRRTAVDVKWGSDQRRTAVDVKCGFWTKVDFKFKIFQP